MRTRGPFVFTITWEPNTPLMCAANVPMGARAAHVRILQAPGLLMSSGDRFLVVIVYDVPDLSAPVVPRQLFGVRQNDAFAGAVVDLAECIGGFVHPVDGAGWLMYEASEEKS